MSIRAFCSYEVTIQGISEWRLYSELVLDSSKLKGLFFYDPIWSEGFIVNPAYGSPQGYQLFSGLNHDSNLFS